MEERTRNDGGTVKSILVIEDSPTQAAHLRDILDNSGYRVSVAGNGREAIAFLARELPDLIVSDVMMPEMDGYKLCRHIKQDPRCRMIPVILLTSLANPQDVIRGLECGADNFITKPYSEEILLSRIGQMWINRRLPASGETPSEMEIFFAGRTYAISADRRQIPNLLLSTYEAAISKNQELIRARDELNELNAQLEAANRELEAFNYTVSHDLRSPLTGINGYCQILTEVCADRIDKQCAGYIRSIEKAARRMDDLITTILNFSRIARSELRREKIDLSEICGAITAQFRMYEPHRRVRFSMTDGIFVNGDARLLRIAMTNLLGNAWKYTGRQENATIEFGATKSDGKPVLFVRDNGAGFDMALADKLFTPFQRLHDSEEFEGHGIGLATVQRIIERHGGRIWADGAPGKGATFYFTL